MKDEQIYFYIFSYSSALYWLVIATLFFAGYLVRKGFKKIACFVVLAVILTDLLAYNLQVLPFVTGLRTGVNFNQKQFDWSLPEHRNENPFLDKRFRYFASGLNNDHTAFDGTAFDRFSAAGNRVADASAMLKQIRLGQFALQKEIDNLSLFELIALGQDSYDDWPGSKKEAFLNFMELLSEDLMFQRNFYKIFPSGEGLLLAARRFLAEGYLDLNSGLAWNTKKDALASLVKLIDFDLDISQEGLGQVIKGNKPDEKSPILAYIRSLGYLYKSTPASEYFMTLWARYRIPSANSFVRLKDFERIYAVYTRSLTDLKMTRQNLRIKSDFGITAPVINFFTSAYFTGQDTYVNDLEQDRITDNRLYLEGKDPSIKTENNPRKDQSGSFSYLVKKYTPNYLKLLCSSKTPGFLYYSDSFDKYWKAKVDGKRVTIYKANGLFKAVNLASGEHTVEFIYDPGFFRFSIWSYYLTILAAVVFLTLRSKIWQKS